MLSYQRLQGMPVSFNEKDYTQGFQGGDGAVIRANYNLIKDEKLLILVGQSPVGTPSSSYGGSAGGGSFVTKGTSHTNSTPFLIAGGGGGAASYNTACDERNGALQINGNQGTNPNSCSSVNSAGSNGNGGIIGASQGSGGGGLLTNGYMGNNAATGQSFRSGGLGGISNHGNVQSGFGGGGTNSGGAGGGGGFSGGGSAGWSNSGHGGGGGSFIATGALNVATSNGTWNNNGYSGTYSGAVSNLGYFNNTQGKVIITHLLPTITTQTPANATKFQNNYIDVSWTGEVMPAGSSITRYDVQAGTTLGGTNILALTNKGTTTTQRFTVPPGTAGNTTIYWQVRAYDHGGNAGPWKQTTVIYSNNVPKITATTNVPAKIDVSLERRHHQLSINSLIDADDFNYVTLFADVLDGSGTLIPGSKQQIVLDSDLMSNSAALIKGTATEKDGSLQGPLNHATPFNLKLYLNPDFTTGKFDLTLTKADGVTNVIKGDKKLLTGRTMQLATAPSPENYTLRIYPEDRQNTNTLANSPLASIPDVVHISMPFTSDTRNYLPRLTNMKDDVAKRVFSDSQGFNKISVNGHVDDSDPADKVTIYYEVQPKAANYSIQVSKQGANMLPANGVATQTFNPKVNHDFAFTYQIDSSLDSREYALLVYGYDSQEGLGSYHEIPFTVDRGGPTIDFTANYTTSGGQTIVMSTAQKQIIAEDNIGKFYFTPNNYATFEYAGYLIRSGAVKDLRIRGAFTNKVKATFIGVNFGQNPITLMNGEQTEFMLGDVIVFKFKATSSTGIVTEKDVRILIGNDASTFAPLDDASLPVIP